MWILQGCRGSHRSAYNTGMTSSILYMTLDRQDMKQDGLLLRDLVHLIFLIKQNKAKQKASWFLAAA